MLTVHYSGTGEPPGGLGVPPLLALEDCSFRVLFLPDSGLTFGQNCAGKQNESGFSGRLASVLRQ